MLGVGRRDISPRGWEGSPTLVNKSHNHRRFSASSADSGHPESSSDQQGFPSSPADKKTDFCFATQGAGSSLQSLLRFGSCTAKRPASLFVLQDRWNIQGDSLSVSMSGARGCSQFRTFESVSCFPYHSDKSQPCWPSGHVPRPICFLKLFLGWRSVGSGVCRFQWGVIIASWHW